MAVYSDINKIRVDFFKVTDDEVFQRILTRASVMAYNFINSYLDGIYTVPITSATTPGAVREISDMLTRHVAQSLQLKQTIVLDKKLAKGDMATILMWLDDIVRGKASIIELTRLSSRGPSHNMADYEPIFHVDPSEYHTPDTDLIESIDDDRD